MDAELTDPLGRLSPLYDLGTELTIRPRGGGTGSNIKDSDIAETLASRPNLFGATQEQAIDDAVNTARGIRAYHGSPHEFEKFKSSKIGTGEGAQAYGHGLYFAESEPIAKSYRDALSQDRPEVAYKGKPLPVYTGRPIEATGLEPEEYYASMFGDKENPEFARNAHIEYLEGRKRSIPQRGDLPPSIKERALKDIDDQIEKIKMFDPSQIKKLQKGHMYEVQINAHPDHFLDWDKPLSEQSEHVKNAFNERSGLFGHGMPYTGKDLYRIFEDMHGDDSQKASQHLYDQGIQGIKYFDAGSRNQGEGTRNFVVFDPNDIEIMRRYARGGDVIFHHANRAERGRTMGNNAIDNALRMARDHFDDGGDVRGGDSPFMSRSDYGLREAPTPSFRQAEDRSMREYERAVESGWSPTGDRGGVGGGASTPSTSPESQLTGRQSGFEGAPSVAMPSSIGELLAYNRNVRMQQQQSQQQQQAEQEATDQRIRDALAMAGVGATKFGDASALASGFPSVAKQSVFWGGEPQGPSAATIDRAMALSQMPNVMGLPAGTTLSRTELPTQAEYYGAPQETPEQMFARSNFGSPQINAQFASAGSPYAVTPSAPQTMFAGTQPAFPHTPTPQQVAQVASAPDVRASFVQPNRPITLTPQPTIEQLTQTAPQQVAQNVPLPPTVARDQIAAAVAAASAPVEVAQATDPLLQNPDALVLPGRKAAQTVPMPLARPTDLPRPGLFDQIRADLDFATGQRINELEAAKQYAGGSPEQVAAAIGVNPSDLKARIVNYDGQPKVDYYTKDLSQALFGDPLKALGAGIGSLFGAKTGDQQVAEAVAAAREGGGGRGQQQVEVAPAVTAQTAPPPYMTELSAGNLALPSTSGLTAEQWAAQNAGGDMSRVHARIKYVNGAPMLEYYTV